MSIIPKGEKVIERALNYAKGYYKALTGKIPQDLVLVGGERLRKEFHD
ncbi:hypothetical protein CHITON_1278 [Thermococcus chitonophagus]|uniref:Uncharacterized protein n=1 Tax=Thermococcus chitonophagus TaxID=54262 RepID=A0A160VSM2_9EURY|nr:hypothetical protein CHITON_1278 [Thermococcus chitonophagus]